MATQRSMSVYKSTPLRFSSVHGQNVEQTNSRTGSHWKLSQHLGVCSTNRPILKGENIEIHLCGSGHVYIGLLKKKPDQKDILEGKMPERKMGDNWIYFRLKDNNYVVSLEKTSSKEVKFRSEHDDKPQLFKIDDCWLCCHLVFGNVEAKIVKKDDKKSVVKKSGVLCFDSVCGPNVNISADATTAKLKNTNPGALCCTDRPVTQGEVIEVKIQSVEDARWTWVRVYISNSSARELKIDHSDVMPSEVDGMFFLTILKNTQATLILRIRDDDQIAYTSRGEEKVCAVTGVDLSRPVYVYFDLFRVTLSLTSVIRSIDDVVDYPKIGDVSPAVADGCEYATPEPNDDIEAENDGYITPVCDPKITTNDNDDGDGGYLTPVAPKRKDDSVVKSTKAGGASKPNIANTGRDPSLNSTESNEARKSTYANVGYNSSSNSTTNPITPPAAELYPENAPGEAGAASGPTQEAGVAVSDLCSQIEGIRQTLRHPSRNDPCYGVLLKDIRKRLESIEKASSTNQEILHTVKSLELQVTELLSDVTVTSQPKPIPDNVTPPTAEIFDNCIKPNFTRFLSDMDADAVTDYLFQYDVITEEVMYKLQSMDKEKKREKNRQILHIIKTKSQKMDSFKEALKESGNQDLADLLK